MMPRLLLLLALTLPSWGATVIDYCATEVAGHKSENGNLRAVPPYFGEFLRSRMRAVVEAGEDEERLAAIELSEVRLAREFSVANAALRRWVTESLTADELTMLEAARKKTNSARHHLGVLKTAENGPAQAPATFRADILQAIEKTESGDLTVDVTLRQFAKKYDVRDDTVRKWIDQQLDAEEQARWKEASEINFRGRARQTRVKPVPPAFKDWMLAHIEKIENGEMLDWFTAPQISIRWRVSLPTFKNWVKEALTEPEQKRFATVAEKARRSRTAKARSLPAPEGLGDLVLTRMELASDDTSIALTSNDLGREFGVSISVVHRWLEEALLPEEYLKWKEIQFDLVARRSSDREKSPLPKDFRSIIMSRITRCEANEPTTLLQSDIAAEFDVVDTGIVRSWLREVLTPTELERYEVAVQKQRRQIQADSKFTKMPEGFREKVLLGLAAAEKGEDAPITIGDLRTEFTIGYEVTLRLVNTALTPEEVVRWEDAVRILLRRRSSDALRKGNFHYEVDGLHYDSKSEYAVSQLLAKYVAGWKPVPDETFQIRSNDGGRFDFAVGKTIVEFHPVILVTGDSSRMIGDLTGPELEDFQKEVQAAPEPEKAGVRTKWRDIAQAHYREARLARMKATPSLQEHSLVVLDNEVDLYDFLKMRGAELPELPKFRNAFRTFIRAL